MATQGFNTRALISLLVTGGFLVMTVTGVVLYVTPQGRVANWIDWTLVGLGKEDWAAVHIASSLLFVIGGVWHLVLNWKPFVHYLHQRIQGHERPRAEGLVALAAVVLLVWGTLAGVPPIRYLLDLNEAAKGMWSLDAGAEPPFGHAEEVTLTALAFRTRMDLADALASLDAAGLRVAEGERTTLRRLADDNGLTPAGVFAVLKAGAARSAPAAPALTAEAVDSLYGGTGIGQKTLAQAAEAAGVPLAAAQARLAALGIEASPTDRLKTLAEAQGLAPMDLLKTMLVEGYRPGAPTGSSAR